jgi:uncharacterized protein YbaR (Trm112 family)
MRRFCEEQTLTPPDEALLAILACPKTHGALRYDPALGLLVSDEAGLGYPLRDGIPLLLVEEARPLAPAADGGA